LTLVERLVRCPSPSGQEGELAHLLIAEMEARGLRARSDDVGNAIGVIGSGPIQVYLVGHMDTVPGDLPVRVEEGKLYGRGSVDAKGSLAVFVEAAAAFKGSSILTLTVIGCVEEEASSRGARHVMEAYPAPDFVVIGEPSGWNAITRGYKGSGSLCYVLRKPRTHRGAPTTTAAEDAVAFYHALCEAYPERGAGFTEVSINLVSFNTYQDGIHERAELSLDVRTPPLFDLGVFRQVVAGVSGQADVEVTQYTPPVLVGKRNALVRAMLGGIRAQGGMPRFKCKTGTSDMNLMQAWACPIIAYGPGDSSLDHTPDEYIDIHEFRKAIAVLTRALATLGG